MFYAVRAEEMAFAMTLFVNAATGQISSGNNPITARNRHEGEALFLTLTLTASEVANPEAREKALGTPLFRAFLIVWAHYGNDELRASIGARLLGFYQLMTRTHGKIVEAWVERIPTTEETVALHPAIVDTIASIPLSGDGTLNEATFVQELESARESYPTGFE